MSTRGRSSTGIGRKGSPAEREVGLACARWAGAQGQVPRIWLARWNNEKLPGVSRMGWRDQAMAKGDVDVPRRIRVGVRERTRADAVNAGADRGASALPRRGAVYVDEAIWEWRGLKWAHLLAHHIDDLHRFAPALGVHRTPYHRPPRASVPHSRLTS